MNSDIIPKIVHYCWISNDEWDLKTKECFDSWLRIIPEYKFMLWNKETLPPEIFEIPTVVNAVNLKKWAFVADYVRIWALCTYGGVYLDLDVQLLKNPSSLLTSKIVFGLEGNQLGGHFISSVKSHPFLVFILDKLKEKTNLMPLPKFISGCYVDFYRHEIVEVSTPDFSIYPNDYFNPFLWDSEIEKGELNITDNTYCIHWYAGGWIPKYKKKWLYRIIVQALKLMHLLPLVRKMRGY